MVYARRRIAYFAQPAKHISKCLFDSIQPNVARVWTTKMVQKQRNETGSKQWTDRPSHSRRKIHKAFHSFTFRLYTYACHVNWLFSYNTANIWLWPLRCVCWASYFKFNPTVGAILLTLEKCKSRSVRRTAASSGCRWHRSKGQKRNTCDTECFGISSKID